MGDRDRYTLTVDDLSQLDWGPTEAAIASVGADEDHERHSGLNRMIGYSVEVAEGRADNDELVPEVFQKLCQYEPATLESPLSKEAVELAREILREDLQLVREAITQPAPQDLSSRDLSEGSLRAVGAGRTLTMEVDPSYYEDPLTGLYPALSRLETVGVISGPGVSLVWDS